MGILSAQPASDQPHCQISSTKHKPYAPPRSEGAQQAHLLPIDRIKAVDCLFHLSRLTCLTELNRRTPRRSTQKNLATFAPLREIFTRRAKTSSAKHYYSTSPRLGNVYRLIAGAKLECCPTMTYWIPEPCTVRPCPALVVSDQDTVRQGQGPCPVRQGQGPAHVLVRGCPTRRLALPPTSWGLPTAFGGWSSTNSPRTPEWSPAPIRASVPESVSCEFPDHLTFPPACGIMPANCTANQRFLSREVEGPAL